MLTVNPPVVVPFAPATQPVASVNVRIGFYEKKSGILNVQVILIDAKGRGVQTDLQNTPRLQAADVKAILATPFQMTDDLGSWLDRAVAPFLKSAYGLDAVPTT